MCENCKDVLCDYRGKSHTPLECPFLSIAYCGICSSRGHFHTQCPDAAVQRSRKPEFLEQLIPPSLKERYRIQGACTPLPTAEPLPAKIPPSMWEIPRKAEVVKDFLEKRKVLVTNLRLKIRTSDKDHNERVLFKLAESQKAIVVWTKSGKQTEKDEEDAQKPETSEGQPKAPPKKITAKTIACHDACNKKSA